MASRITGATLITAAAIICPNTVWYWPANWAMTSGTVCAGWRVRISAKKNSFHASMKAKIAAAKSGGHEIGRMTYQNVANVPAPSTAAACSMSRRDAEEEAAQDPDHDRQVEGQVDDAEREYIVDQAQLADDDEQRDGDGDAGKHLGGEDQERYAVGARHRQARKRIGGRRAQRQRHRRREESRRSASS